jgi:hypothetical protein
MTGTSAALQAPYTPIATRTLPDNVHAAMVGFITPVLVNGAANSWASELPGYLAGVAMSPEQITRIEAVPRTCFGSASDESWVRQRLVQRVGGAKALEAILLRVAFPSTEDQTHFKPRRLILTSLLDYFNRGVCGVRCLVFYYFIICHAIIVCDNF